MSDFVFVGTEGCGKTVLITALSKLYGPTSDQELQLNPANRSTAEYVERAWQALKHSDWPPSTPPGQRVNLEWHYIFTSGFHGRMRLLDSAGQDLRQLFAEDQVMKIDELPGPLQLLAQEIATARAVVFLVNLRDFLGEQDSHKRLANEWLLRGAMDYRESVRPGAPKCLVFTQSDLYRSELSSPDAVRTVAFRHLPHVAGMYLRDGTVPLFAVSAVGKTINVPDETGRLRRVPDGKLHCSGFSSLVGWMESCTRMQSASTPATPRSRSAGANNEWAARTVAMPPTPAPATLLTASSTTVTPPSEPRAAGPSDEEWSKIMWGIFIVIVLFLLPMLRSCNERAKQKEDLHKIINDVYRR